MGNDVEGLPDGTGLTTESCPTRSTEPTETTPKTAFFGVAKRATLSVIPDRSLPLSADEGQRLARIARDRANRYMVSSVDVDFLLDLLTRFSR